MVRGALAGAVCAALLGVVAAPARASAQDVTGEARVHFDRGLALLSAQNYDGALAEFERSHALSPRPSVLYNIAVTLQALRRYPEAARTLERYLRDAGTLPPARRAEAQRVMAQLRALVAHVRVAGVPEGATLAIDGVEVASSAADARHEVGPGRHVLEARANDRVVARAEISIASGEDRRVALQAVPGAVAVREQPTAPTAPPPPLPLPPATLRVRAIREARVTVDGRPFAVDEVQPVAPGRHRVEVLAPGRTPWRGEVAVSAAQRREIVARVTGAGGLPPAAFGAAAAVTVALGAAAAVTGGLTLAARAEYEAIRNDFDPRLDEIAARGVALRTATNVLLVATGVVGITSVVLLTRTRFSPPRLTVDVALAPDGSAGGASARLRF